MNKLKELLLKWKLYYDETKKIGNEYIIKKAAEKKAKKLK